MNELSFVADNLAHFPYQVMDEPLYVIYQADSIISISGQNIFSNFKSVLKPSQKKSNQLDSQMHASASHSSSSISLDEDDEDFSEESLMSKSNIFCSSVKNKIYEF